MVIDKTIGKGCAWSITSKVTAKKLIAEGIINKPIGSVGTVHSPACI